MIKNIYLSTFILFIFSCNNPVFIEKPKLVESVDISILNYGIDKVLIYKSESNATTNESIQLRVKKDKEERIIKFYERYDMVIDYKLEGSLLNLILQDTSGVRNKIDTIFFNLSELSNYIK